MHDPWPDLVSKLLRPSRPDAARCARERDGFELERRAMRAEQASAISDCVRRIEEAREQVFAAGDGRVPRTMTDLEREWRRLARVDPEAGVMDLWARVAPAAWLDRKPWRGADLDLAMALATDVSGVDRAEASVRSLRERIGADIGPRIRWAWLESDVDAAFSLLAGPLALAQDALSRRDWELVAFARAHALEDAVHDSVLATWPDRPMLARSVSLAALVEAIWIAAALPAGGCPVAPLRELWATGYVITVADAEGVTLAMPRPQPQA